MDWSVGGLAGFRYEMSDLLTVTPLKHLNSPIPAAICLLLMSKSHMYPSLQSEVVLAYASILTLISPGFSSVCSHSYQRSVVLADFQFFEVHLSFNIAVILVP